MARAGWGRRALGRPVLVAGAALAAAGPLLQTLGQTAPAAALARTSVAVCTLLAVVVLIRRVRARSEGRGAWALLVLVVLAQAAWALRSVGAEHVGSRTDNLAHLGAGLVAAVALWLLPAPPEDRRGVLRTVLDAAAAGFAVSIPAWELLDPLLRSGGTWSGVTTVGHALVSVSVATVVVAVLARARRVGGLPMPALVAVAGGVGLWAVADVHSHAGGSAPVVTGTVAFGAALVAAGAGSSTEVGESERGARLREAFAVLVPFAPLSVAAAVLLGAPVFHAPLSPVTLGLAVLLAGALLTGGVLARLDSLAVERRLDDLVLERTITIGTREKWFRSLVQNSSDVITVVDVRGVVRYQTPSVTRILGHDPQVLVGTRLSGLLRPADGRRLEAALASAARNPARSVSLEFPIWHKAGRWCDTETTVTSLVHDPDIRGLVLNTRDVSERRRLQEQLTQQAYSDPLTGLANRALFRRRVKDALATAVGTGKVAVLFLDLDGFKAVNDAHGHHVGDELLGIVGKRLSHAVRPGDVVARLGGDEFGILVTGDDAEEASIWVAERVRRSLSAPFVLAGRELSLGASTGISVSDRNSRTADALLRNADLAMYRAKGRRDLAFVRFEAEMHDVLLARVQAEADLRQAVSRGDLVLHYQPVVELSSGRIIGVEALVRWRHHERGLISPGEFIDLAEETGLVNEIGSWALTECALQGARWQRHAAPGRVFKVAVNVSARQLDAGLPRLLRDAIVGSGLPGSAMTLEMTESVLMDRTDEVVELLRRMKTMGVKVAIDDFGTGYSSLSYLARFPVDILKIDRSFVANIGSEHTGQGELVQTIIRLGEALRLETVAEGIETEMQRDTLQRMGCTHGQGFLFARPMPAEELDDLLSRQEAIAAATG